jgi:O-antigen/teichoic acid export membrane protein
VSSHLRLPLGQSARSREIAVASLLALAVRCLGVLAVFIMNVALTNTLGPEQSGYFLFSFTLITFLAAVGRCGFDNVLLRYTAGFHDIGDQLQSQQVLVKCGLMTLAVSSCLATSLFFLSPIVGELLDRPNYVIPLRWLAPSVVLLALTTLVGMSFQGMKKIVASVITINIGTNLAMVISLYFLALVTADQAARTFNICVAVTLVTAFIYWIFLTGKPLFPELLHKSEVTLRGLSRSAFPLWIVIVLAQVVQWSGQLVAAGFILPEEIAQFSVAQRTALLTSLALNAINLVLAPRIASLNMKGDMDEIRRLSFVTVRLLWVISLPLVVSMIFAAGFLMSLFGESFASGAHLLRILVCGQFVNLITGPVGFLLMMTGHERDMRNSLLLSAPLGVALSLILIPAYGVVGAAVATAISIALQNLAACFLVRQRLGFNVLSFWRQ